MKLDTIGVQFFERLTLSHRPQVLLGPSWGPSGPGKRQLYMGCQDGGVVIGPGNGDGLETPPLILLPHASPLRVILGRLLHQLIVDSTLSTWSALFDLLFAFGYFYKTQEVVFLVFVSPYFS